MRSVSEMSKAFVGGGFVLLLTFALASHATGQTCVHPPADLVSWWPGDGDATDIADANDGTLQGGTTFAQGLVGQAFSFPGISGNSVTLGDPANLKVQNLTVDAWIKPTGPGTFGDYIGNQIFTNDPRGLSFLHASSTGRLVVVLEFTDGPVVFHTSTGTVPMNDFSHIAFTWDGSTIRLYINGAPDSDLFVGPRTLKYGDPDAFGEFLIGAHGPFWGGRRAFRGLIDEVEMFDRALSSVEIQAIFKAGGAGKCKTTAVAIDIKLGSFPNSINPRSKGNIPVAILTTGTFDATTVDSTTVRFGATGTEAAPLHSALADVDGDGDTDLILHFNTQDTVIQCGDTSASLTGETLDGQMIQGSDSVKTAGCK